MGESFFFLFLLLVAVCMILYLVINKELWPERRISGVIFATGLICLVNIHFFPGLTFPGIFGLPIIYLSLWIYLMSGFFRKHIRLRYGEYRGFVARIWSVIYMILLFAFGLFLLLSL